MRQKKFTRVNQQIRAPKIRLIDEKGGNLGVFDVPSALKIGQEKGLDIVEVGPNADPPVVKLIDYQKHRYRQQKTRPKKQQSKLKMVRFSIRTSEHDLATKVHKIEKFLQEGHKVQLHLFMRGREKAHRDYGQEKLAEFLKLITVEYVIEQPVKSHPSGFFLMIRKK